MHPTDRLIREIITRGRSATTDEIQEIIERMATSPFNPQLLRVPVRHRGSSYLGHALGAREPSLVYHLVKRVVIEEQWVRGTTAREYLADLRRAVRDPATRLAIYERGGEHIAATMTPTETILPPERRGARFLTHLVVIHSADDGIIRTGYQVSDLSRVDIPTEARWLN